MLHLYLAAVSAVVVANVIIIIAIFTTTRRDPGRFWRPCQNPRKTPRPEKQEGLQEALHPRASGMLLGVCRCPTHCRTCFFGN